MAKIYGLQGVMTGKLANTVMVVRNGEQIARKYQPVVTNPSTTGQVAARAKLKMMSQLSAIMAPVIAMPREGAVSTRNLFTKENYGAATYSDNTASVTLTSIKLTRSVVSLPAVLVARDTNSLTPALADTQQLDIDRVVYAAFRKMPDNTLRLAGTAIISEAGVNNSYPAVISVESPNSAFVVYAYGIRDNNEAARAYFGNVSALSAETVAKLIVNRVLKVTDITLTETRGVELAAQA